MKVLFVSPFLSYHGHIKRMGALKAKSMADAELDVTVMGFPLTYDLLVPGSRLRYISVQDGLSPKARARVERWSRRFGNVWLFLVETFWVQCASLRYAWRHKFPIVFICDIEPWLLLPLLILAKILWRGPEVAGCVSFLFNAKSSMPHELKPQNSMRSPPWYTCVRVRLNYRAVMCLPRWMDIITDCKHTIQAQSLPAATHAIMEGCEKVSGQISCDDAREMLGIQKQSRVILHFGVATPGKGTELLIEALNGISPVFELYIVGKSGIYSRDSLLDGLPAEWRSHVHMESRYVTEAERSQYFSACNAVALPYRYGFPSCSGNFLDAIGFGKAILVSDQFMIGEMVRKYDLGILFKPDDVNDLRRALVEFTQKPDTWFQGIAERSKVIVEDFSLEKVGLRHRELFERLVAEGKR